MPNHKLHHASIFGTVLAKRLLVSLNRIASKNVRVESKKGLICTEVTEPRSLAGSALIPNASFMDREEPIDRANFSPEAVSAESKSAALGGIELNIRKQGKQNCS